MPSIIDELTSHVLAWQSREKIADVRIGLGYTAVELSSGHCGLSGIVLILGAVRCFLGPGR